VEPLTSYKPSVSRKHKKKNKKKKKNVVLLLYDKCNKYKSTTTNSNLYVYNFVKLNV